MVLLSTSFHRWRTEAQNGPGSQELDTMVCFPIVSILQEIRWWQWREKNFTNTLLLLSISSTTTQDQATISSCLDHSNSLLPGLSVSTTVCYSLFFTQPWKWKDCGGPQHGLAHDLKDHFGAFLRVCFSSITSSFWILLNGISTYFTPLPHFLCISISSL
jgi:hypothetical protein